MDKKVNSATRAKNKYNAKAYDSLRIVVPKGKKEVLQAHVSKMGVSLNAYVNEAINEKVERDLQTDQNSDIVK